MALAKGSGCGFGIIRLFEKPEATVGLGKPQQAFPFDRTLKGLSCSLRVACNVPCGVLES